MLNRLRILRDKYSADKVKLNLLTLRTKLEKSVIKVYFFSSENRSIVLSFYRSIVLSFYRFIVLSFYRSIVLSFYRSIVLSFYRLFLTEKNSTI